ncbi:MAG: 3-oxoacyl-ACP synthase III [Verrucomicrobia bacterium]|nr:MAG: 3-oxoacyl-ACP synthase III [Verrucomicrobiota bacterium]
MRFDNVVIESIAYEMPPEVWTSAEIERRLAPVYERLRLPEGRLELMTGIRERRFWPKPVRASAAAAMAGRRVLEKSRIAPERIQLLAHTSVCRDMLEPATASFVHRELALPATTQVFDLSNACLGFLNGMVLAAGLIESGQIECALLVSGEDGRPLVEQTIATLLREPLTRKTIKPYFANLTIGSAAVAAVLCHRSLAPDGHRLLGGSAMAATQHNDLCQGDHAGTGGLAMQTDSEELLRAGVALARENWNQFLDTLNWTPETPARFICHQVGSMHRKALYETLRIDLARDFSTFEILGNTGSAALPITLAHAEAAGAVRGGDKVALLGIGSGINCLMLGVEW